ncbi:MAG TPA: LysM peptidoglycan-binding domain-containing protein [Acidimicrobiales bacterium]|nr:LysM peptidoglycan-binding domain-containing protein [Acidimicrobiales bacterium]
MRRSPHACGSRTRRFWPAALLAAATTGALALGDAPAASASTYTVQKGQTLIAIANRLHTTVAALVAANHLADPNKVLAGEVLQVPSSGAGTAGDGLSLASFQVPVAVASTYTVQKGQTLIAIANRLHTTVAALVAANHLADPNKVLAGQVLQVPSSGAGTPGGPGIALASYQVPQSTGHVPPELAAHPSRLALQPDFANAAATYGIPLPLLEALCWWESGWQPNLVSSTGAIGVCQVEPQTAAFVNQTLVHANLDPHVASQNIALGAAYLASLLKATGGDVNQALAGYYQGLGSVKRIGMLPFTALYVHGIEAYATIFAG